MKILQRWAEQFQDWALARRMQDGGHVGFFDYQFEGDRFGWRQGSCRLFGLQAAPQGGIKSWYARIRDADRARVERELWTACALRRPHATLDYGVADPDGTARHLSTRIALAYTADGRPRRMSAVTIDVTDRQLDAMRRVREELAATLNHQFRTPLGALSSAAEVLQTLAPDSPDAQEARAIVARQTARLAQLLDDLSEPCADGSPQPAPLGKAPPIVDIELPRLDDVDLARHARASGHSGRRVSLSGLGTCQNAQDPKVAGFDPCLIKPVDRGQLRSSLADD